MQVNAMPLRTNKGRTISYHILFVITSKVSIEIINKHLLCFSQWIIFSYITQVHKEFSNFEMLWIILRVLIFQSVRRVIICLFLKERKNDNVKKKWNK